MSIEPWVLKQRQSLPLPQKIIFSSRRIREFYEEMDGQVYVSVSGRDSVVLLDMVRTIYPDVKAVFVNTRLEFPEIVQFWKEQDNVEIIYPRYSFKEVLDVWGYPVISKKVSMAISRFRNTGSDLQKELRLHGGVNPTSGRKQSRTIPIKYHHMVDAPFKISDECCNHLKKNPLKHYHKDTGLHPFTGEMADDSRDRQENYLKQGCNIINRGIPKSTPLGIWLQQDILDYIEAKGLLIPSVYDNGYDSTGCMFCMFGLQQEIKNNPGQPNRFQKMKQTHPKQYDYCINKLGIGEVLDFMGIDYD